MKTFFKIFLAIALVSTFGFVAFADRHISTNDLPNEAKAFINTHYNGVDVYDCEIDDFNYDVDLSNGVDLVFNKSGKLLKIESDHGVLSQSVLKSVLPAKAIEYLTTKGLVDRIDEVELRQNTIVVDINNSNDQEVRFNLDGTLRTSRR